MSRLERVIDAEAGEMRLDRALALLFPEHSRSFLAGLVDAGQVAIDARTALKTSQKVRAGQLVAIDVPPPAPIDAASQEIPLTVIFEDSDVVVLNKPAGLVVHPAAGHADHTLVNALLFHVKDLSGIGGALRPGIVHRLDKETSGVMVVVKNDESHRKLTADWGTEKVRKEYLAIVYGTPSADKGTIDAPIGRDPRERKRMAVVHGARHAITDYVVAERLRHASLLRCRLRTGRTHQIRVHLKHLGHPIIGDPLYSGPQWKGIPDKILQRLIAGFHRQALHAFRLTFPHPRTGETMTFEAPMPVDLEQLLAGLR